MKKCKALSWLFSVSLLASLPVMTAKAETIDRDGLTISLTADKAAYTSYNDIACTLSVVNHSNDTVYNVVLENNAPAGCMVASGSSGKSTAESLAPQETASLTTRYSALSASTPSSKAFHLNPYVEPQPAATKAVTAAASSSSTAAAAAPTGGSNERVVDSPVTDDTSSLPFYTIVLALSIGTVLVTVRGKKSTKNLMAILLCLGVAGSSGASVITKAAEISRRENKTVTISEKIMVDGEETLLTATVSYEKDIPQNDNLNDDVIDLGDIQTSVMNGDIKVMYNEKGNLISINGKFTDEKVNSAADAAKILNASASLFDEEEFRADASKIRAVEINNETGGKETFYRYTPTIGNVPVNGNEIILAVDKDGNVESLNTTFDKNIYNISTSASITAAKAEEKAFETLLADEDISKFLDSCVTGEKTKDQVVAKFKEALDIKSELAIFENDSAPVLTYNVTISSVATQAQAAAADAEAEQRESIEAVLAKGVKQFEDNEEAEPAKQAADSLKLPNFSISYRIYANGEKAGEVYKQMSNMMAVEAQSHKDALGNYRTIFVTPSGSQYQMKDTSRMVYTYNATRTSDDGWFERTNLPGELVTSWGVIGTHFNKEAVSLHANMEDTYDFYYTVLGSNSYDNAGAKIVSTRDYDDEWLPFVGFDNACWVGGTYQQFIFGTHNYESAKDVVGHEFTHAVSDWITGWGSNYSGETGALNEAYSDILGSFVEGKSGDDFWKIGEDANGGPLRNMKNPSEFNQPDNYSAMSDPAWSARLDQYKNRDNEGVHIYNSIYTYAVYLMMNDSRTASVSRNTWADIFYRSIQRLGSNATFLDGRAAVLCAANKEGFTSDQQQAIRDAFDKVGIVEPDAVRIVLTWGSTPQDIDSHLLGPISNGSKFHIYYMQKTIFPDGTYDTSFSLPEADLDYDDTTSYGPEITTIHALTPGEYTFYVHDYSNAEDYGADGHHELAQSGATVKVFRGNATDPIAEYTVDGTSEGVNWNVFKLTIDSSKNVSIEAINTYDNNSIYD